MDSFWPERLRRRGCVVSWTCARRNGGNKGWRQVRDQLRRLIPVGALWALPEDIVERLTIAIALGTHVQNI